MLSFKKDDNGTGVTMIEDKDLRSSLIHTVDLKEKSGLWNPRKWDR
jgi:hypothetical protein